MGAIATASGTGAELLCGPDLSGQSCLGIMGPRRWHFPLLWLFWWVGTSGLHRWDCLGIHTTMFSNPAPGFLIMVAFPTGQDSYQSCFRITASVGGAGETSYLCHMALSIQAELLPVSCSSEHMCNLLCPTFLLWKACPFLLSLPKGSFSGSSPLLRYFCACEAV
jgi:hypothetical protein